MRSACLTLARSRLGSRPGREQLLEEAVRLASDLTENDVNDFLTLVDMADLDEVTAWTPKLIKVPDFRVQLRLAERWALLDPSMSAERRREAVNLARPLLKGRDAMADLSGSALLALGVLMREHKQWPSALKCFQQCSTRAATDMDATIRCTAELMKMPPEILHPTHKQSLVKAARKRFESNPRATFLVAFEELKIENEHGPILKFDALTRLYKSDLGVDKEMAIAANLLRNENIPLDDLLAALDVDAITGQTRLELAKAAYTRGALVGVQLERVADEVETVEARVLLGEYLWNVEEDQTAALHQFRAALAMPGEKSAADQRALLVAAEAFDMLGLDLDAEATFSCAASSGSAGADLLAARALFLLDRMRLPEAAATAQQAYEAMDTPAARFVLGLTLLRQGNDLVKARRLVESAAGPRLPDRYRELHADTLADLQRWDGVEAARSAWACLHGFDAAHTLACLATAWAYF